MLTCPACNSENVYFSKKRCCNICEDCGKIFREDTKLKLFFSYGHDKHKNLVDLIRKRLEECGHVVWIDHNDIVFNNDWRQEITKGVIGSDEIISFMSKHSLRDPGVCLNEVQIAISIKNERVLRIHLEETKEIKPSTAISSRQYLDMKDWETYYKQGGEVWNEWFDKKMSELIRCIEDPENAQFDGEITELSRKLHPIDYLTRARILLKDEFRGRKWLLAKYAQWKNSSDSNMFALYGIPGAGKSAFASRLFDEDYDVIASVFFEFNRKDMSDLDNITNVIAFQIACKLPDYREYLLYCLNNDSAFLDLKGITRFDSYIITPLRNCIVGSRDKQIIIIDSLDEAYDLNKELVVSLLSRLKLLPRWIKVLVTSRYNSAIDVLLDNAVKTHIEKETDDNNSDLKAYLSDYFENSPRINELVNKCEGSFLYASMLCQKANQSNEYAEELLKTNGGLDSFYYQDFHRKFNLDNGLDYSKYRPILELICASGEISELLICSVLNCDTYLLNDFKRLFIDYIGLGDMSFWYIHDDKRIDRCYQTIKFFHKSISDWITNQNSSNEFYIDKQNGSKKLAQYILLSKTNVTDGSLKDYINHKYWYTGDISALLIKGGLFDEYIECLQNRDYYKLWYYVVDFPNSIDISPIVQTLVDRIQKAQAEAYEITYCDKQIDFDIFSKLTDWYRVLAHCLSDSRFSDTLTQVLNGKHPHPGYFASPFCDDDFNVMFTKPQIGAALSDCLDQADTHGYIVPAEIRHEINMFMLCTCTSDAIPVEEWVDKLFAYKKYYREEGFCSLSLEEISKYRFSDDLLECRRNYNSLCLSRYILICCNEELTDSNKTHIRRLIEYGADYSTCLSYIKTHNRWLGIRNEEMQTMYLSRFSDIWNELSDTSSVD